jgi:hypothetical protein
MVNEQAGATLHLRILKWVQIALAMLVTGFLVLLLPGVVTEFGVPLGCLYIAWSVRASSRHKLSVWFAFQCVTNRNLAPRTSSPGSPRWCPSPTRT